ncbi:MAG: fused MFS/spermidine synthase [Anaerolineaceae bacterium]|jgi:spermidine synthase|nr:fused MFS/spermidine synthase [Anaerolineaceae bacterium]
MRKYNYVAIFFSGLTTLGVEMAASRLLGNVFGTSNLVWASIIGLILIYLAAGYFIGGKWADRSGSEATFYKIIIWSAISTALVPLLSRPVLRLAANAFDELQLGILFGSFTSVLILLAIPMTLMGTASPFAIRLAIHDTENVGKISGRIYGISTFGSFIGTFLPALLLFPTIGTYRTFLLFGFLLLIVGLIGLWLSSGWRKTLPYIWLPLAMIALAIWGLGGTDKASSGQIYETESSYNYIQVLEKDDFVMLRLNEGQGVHSIYHPTQLSYFGPWEQVLAAPYFNAPPYVPENVKKIAIVGLAAGTTARQATEAYGNIQIDGYEIDPKIVDVARKYFDMNQENLNVFVQDGRWGLAHSQEKYQIISLDAYRPPYIPYHMTTREFFQIAREHLTDDGVLVLNVGRAPNDRRMIDALSTTLLTIFPNVHVIDLPYSFNSILYATVQPTTPDNLKENLKLMLTREPSGEISPLLIQSVEIAMLNQAPAPQETIVFTDDKAPVEWITNAMVLNFIFSDEVDNLQ